MIRHSSNCGNALVRNELRPDPAARWRPAEPDDTIAINSIADQMHPQLPERQEVFEEKIHLFNAGCLVLVQAGRVAGYGISHPWKLGSVPPLDTFIDVLPTDPDCIFIHDVAILPDARGRGSAESFVQHVAAVALSRGISSLALVSVYGTDPMWSKYGFKVQEELPLRTKLQSYGDDAKYMVADLT